jgi:hypothetical protein
MKENFDVSLEDIRNKFFVTENPGVIWDQARETAVIAGNWEMDIKELEVHERMAEFASLMVLDEEEWISSKGVVTIPKKRKPVATVADDEDAMPLDVVEEEDEEDEEVQDWGAEAVQRTMDLVGRELEKTTRGIRPSCVSS